METNPLNAQYALQNSKYYLGFYGASSVERLPTEIAITQKVKIFAGIKMNTTNRNRIN